MCKIRRSGPLRTQHFTAMGWIPSWLQPVSAPAIPGDGGVRHGDSSAAPISATSQATAQASSRPEHVQNPYESHLAAPVMQYDEDEMTSTEGPLLAIPATAFAIGFGAGLYQAAKRSSLVFMAENAHRRPDTVQGWYFYNKTKVSGPTFFTRVDTILIVHLSPLLTTEL